MVGALEGNLGTVSPFLSASSVMCCRGGLSLHTTVLRDHKAGRTFQHSVAHTLPFQIDRVLLSSTQEAHKETKHNVGDIIMT